jgi:hypothetical protein
MGLWALQMGLGSGSSKSLDGYVAQPLQNVRPVHCGEVRLGVAGAEG